MEKEKEEFSGERFYPEMQDEELEIEHLQRYYAAQKLVVDKDVLDAACGEGYGSNILSQKAKSVIGVDIDQETVDRANNKYGAKENLEYRQGSIAELNMIPDASRDVVVSFETIEHVPREVQQEFIKEIKRILRPDGFMIMSTPNKKEYTDRYNFHNQFHVAEFYVEEFIDFLKQEFKNVQLYNQYLEVASFIDEETTSRENIDYIKDIEKYNPKGKYVIAIASNVELPKEKMCAVHMHHREEYLPTLDELNYCRSEAITCRKKVEHLDECINENKLQKEELERRLLELEHRQELINQLTREKADLENKDKLQQEELDRRLVELEHRQDVINQLRQVNNEKQVEIERRLQELEDYQNIIHQQEAELKKLRQWSIPYQMKKIFKRF